MSHRKTKYVANLSTYTSVCEMNYAKLMKLLPDPAGDESRQVCMPGSPGQQVTYRLSVNESFRYTSTLILEQQESDSCRWLKTPVMMIRLYHDVCMAEVINAQTRKQYQGVYPYPNVDMHQPDEKLQLNQFLAECLNALLSQGVESRPVVIV